MKSQLEMLFAEQARTSNVAGVADFERQWRFDPVRKWAVDFAWLGDWLALEIEGGIWTGGAHARGLGIERDIEKGNALTLAGWRLVRASNHMVEDGRAIALIERLVSTVGARATRQSRRLPPRTAARSR